MAKSYASAVIPAPADQVWQVVRDFDGVPHWHPGIAESTMADGAHSTEVGAVRHLTLGDGGTVRERLVALDDIQRLYTYDMLEGPFAIRTYRSTIRVAAITDTDQSFVEWYAHYDAEAADEADLDKTFAQGVYGAGLRGLRGKFGG